MMTIGESINAGALLNAGSVEVIKDGKTIFTGTMEKLRTIKELCVLEVKSATLNGGKQVLDVQ